MWVFTSQDRAFQAVTKKTAPNREPCLFACHCQVGCTLPGAPVLSLASQWIPAGGHWGATTYRASVTNEGEKCASSYRKVVWQPPVLIKNALTLNAPINLSMLYLAGVALCTVYKTRQLKQVLLASSRPSQA